MTTTIKKSSPLRAAQQQEKQHTYYNRFEKYLLDNFDTNIKEVRQLELLFIPLVLTTLMVLDSIFHFIG